MESKIRDFLQRWKCGWSELLQYLACRGWLPSERVLLHRGASATAISVPGFLPAPLDGKGVTDQFVAVELPEDACLIRRLQLPAVSENEMGSAIQLEVESASPFPPEETQYGWHLRRMPDGPVQIAIAISARNLIRQAIEAQRAIVPELPAVPEVWAPVGEGHAVVHGYGEQARVVVQRKSMRRFQAATVFALALALLLALTPLLQKRLQVVQANHYLAALSAKAAPVLRLREDLGKLQSVAGELAPRLGAGHDLIGLLDRISAVVPDGAWLDHLEYTGSGLLRFGGRADDAAALLQTLQRQPAFRNVRAMSPIVREPRSGKEMFVFELELAS